MKLQRATLLFLVWTTPLAAQEQPTTAMIQTQVADPSMADFGRAIDRVARGRAQELGVVRFSSTPALSLEDIQLMVGCLNASVECYSAFAQQLEVEALLIPTLERAGDDYVVTITFFDSRDGSLEQADRRARRDAVEESLIDSLEGLLRELFDLPPPEPGLGAELPDRQPRTETVRTLSPVGPIIGATGAAVLVAALGVGIAANNAEDDYLAAPVGSRAEVDEALSLRSGAQTKARAANALIGVGAATLVAGVLLIILLKNETERAVSVAPEVTRTMLGLSVGGRL